MGLPVVDSRIKGTHQESKCPHCNTLLEYIPPDLLPTSFLIRCGQCRSTHSAPSKTQSSATPSNVSKSQPGKSKSRNRKIGTDDDPIDMTYYEVLGVSHKATLQEIKSAYRRLAIKYHPDKNPDDETCEAKFKEVALAYSTLSDPELRSKYNEFGKAKAAGGEDGVIDPEAVFSSLFGGERFVDLIGTISLGAEMKSAMQQGDEEVEKKTADMTPEEKKKKAEEDRKQSEARAKVREERVTLLTAKLLKKLQLFTMQARGTDDEEVRNSVQKIWQIEMEDLRTESFGVEILQTLGFVYSAKAQHYMASDSTPWGVGGWFHSARSTAHVFSETWSTLKTAVEVQRVFKELSEAENKGLTEEKKKELEDKAAAKGFLAMFKVVKLDIESVTREVCERILSDADISKEELRLRTAALNILGGVYASVEKDESTFTLADQLRQNLSSKSNSGTTTPVSTSSKKPSSPSPSSAKS